MPLIDFDQLPDSARVWVFASDRPLTGADADALLAEVDGYLGQWKAHGVPLRCAREWRDDRFLVIGVDPTHEQASGCSIDALFRGLQALEGRLATRLVAGGRVFYRAPSGEPALVARAEVAAAAERGALSHGTIVFDTTLTSAGAYRRGFELPARDSWVAALLRPVQASQPSSRSATNASSVRNG